MFAEQPVVCSYAAKSLKIENQEFNNSFSRRKKLQVSIIKLSNNSYDNFKQEVSEYKFTNIFTKQHLMTRYFTNVHSFGFGCNDNSSLKTSLINNLTTNVTIWEYFHSPNRLFMLKKYTSK